MRCKERFSHNLKMLMARDGVDARRLAEAVEANPASVSRWIAAIEWPSAVHLDRIADVFGWSVEALLSETDQDRAPGSDVSLREAVETVLRELGFDKSKLVKSR
jgi:hypothetical protein